MGFEATTYSENIASIKSQNKNGLQVIDCVKYATIPKEATHELSSLLTAFDVNPNVYKTYKYVQNIDHILHILGDSHQRSQILFDWIVHNIDLNNKDCVDSVTRSLTK